MFGWNISCSLESGDALSGSSLPANPQEVGATSALLIPTCRLSSLWITCESSCCPFLAPSPTQLEEETPSFVNTRECSCTGRTGPAQFFYEGQKGCESELRFGPYYVHGAMEQLSIQGRLQPTMELLTVTLSFHIPRLWTYQIRPPELERK